MAPASVCKAITTKPNATFPHSLEKTSISWILNCSIRSGHWVHMRWSGAVDTGMQMTASPTVRRSRSFLPTEACNGQTCLCSTGSHCAATGGGLVIGNGIEGKTSGVEAWGSYQATREWRLSGGVVLLRQRLELKPDSTSAQGVSAEGNDPKHHWMLRSLYELTERHELDIMVRHVGELPDPVLPAYTAVDGCLGRRADRTLDLSLTRQTLF